MALARKEAQRLGHDCIGTEHILLGLIHEGTGVAANVLKNVLKNQSFDPRRICDELQKQVERDSTVDVAANVLKNLGLDLERIRGEVEKQVKRGSAFDSMRQLPFTGTAKKALEAAMEEADSLRHEHIGTKHLLLGLIRDREALAPRILVNLGLDLEIVRKEVLALLGVEPGRAPPAQA